MHAYRPSTNSRSLALKILSSLFQISFRNLWYFSFYFPSVLGVFINPKMKEPSVNTGVKNRTCWWIWAPVDRLPRHEWGGRVFARRDDTPHARIASGPTLGRLPECVLFFKSYHYLSFQLHNASKETFYRHISGNLQNRRVKKCFVKEKVLNKVEVWELFETHREYELSEWGQLVTKSVDLRVHPLDGSRVEFGQFYKKSFKICEKFMKI